MSGVAALPDRVIRGGAPILQLQAAAGFVRLRSRGFGLGRLKLPELGLDARESGMSFTGRSSFLERGADAGRAEGDDAGSANEVLLRQCIVEA